LLRLLLEKGGPIRLTTLIEELGSTKNAVYNTMRKCADEGYVVKTNWPGEKYEPVHWEITAKGRMFLEREPVPAHYDNLFTRPVYVPPKGYVRNNGCKDIPSLNWKEAHHAHTA